MSISIKVHIAIILRRNYLESEKIYENNKLDNCMIRNCFTLKIKYMSRQMCTD